MKPKRSTLFATDVWDDLVNRVAVQGLTVRMDKRDRNQAHRLRMHFYKYRMQLWREARLDPQRLENKEEITAKKARGQDADAVLIRLVPSAGEPQDRADEKLVKLYDVIFMPKNETPDMELLKAAMDEAAAKRESHE